MSGQGGGHSPREVCEEAEGWGWAQEDVPGVAAVGMVGMPRPGGKELASRELTGDSEGFLPGKRRGHTYILEGLLTP